MPKTVETYANGVLVTTRVVAVPVQDENRDRIVGKVTNALAQLEQADADWATLTAAQRTAAMQLAVRVSAKLARLLLGRLEAE